MALILNNISFFHISENAISLEFGGDISEWTLERISKLNECIKQNPFVGLLSTIPAYTTLTLYFNAFKLVISCLVTANETQLKYFLAKVVRQIFSEINYFVRVVNTISDN